MTGHSEMVASLGDGGRPGQNSRVGASPGEALDIRASRQERKKKQRASVKAARGRRHVTVPREASRGYGRSRLGCAALQAPARSPYVLFSHLGTSSEL
jgi:hypothetical protein